MIRALRRAWATSARADVLIGLGLFLLPLAFFWQVTLGGKTLLPADNLYQYAPWSAYRAQVGVPDVPHNTLLSDLVLENYAWKLFTRQAIQDRQVPLWNPYLFAGTPFLAEGQHSALYPFSLIYDVLPLDRAYGWFTVTQLWLAGLLMYLFMRGLGVGRLGAVFAAIVYQFSAFFLASVVFPMIIAAAAWLPFLLLMIEFILRRRPLFGRPAVLPWISLGGIGLGMCILAGHVEFLYYTLLVMGFWAACRLIGRYGVPLLTERIRPGRELLSAAISLSALIVIGLGVGAVQFVPLLELASHNFREGSTSFATVRDYAYPPRHALEFLMPNIYGSPAEHSYFDVFSGKQTAFGWKPAPDQPAITDTYWEIKNYVEGACYVGLLTLILAGIALLDSIRASPHPKSLSRGRGTFQNSGPTPLPLGMPLPHVLGKVGMGQEVGGEALYGAVRAEPPYRGLLALLAIISLAFIFGTPLYAILYYGLPGVNQLHSPFRWVWPLTFALAALAGFGAEALRKAREDRSFFFRLARPLGWGVIGAGGIVLVALLLSRVFYTRISGGVAALFHKLAGADTRFPDVATFYSVEFRSILIFGVLLVASGVVIRLSRSPIYLPRAFGRRPIWEPLALIVILADLVAASAGFNPAADPAWLTFEPPPITWLKQHDPQNWRFTTIEWIGHSHTLNANLGWLYGLQDMGGYDSIINKQYVDYMQRIAPQGSLIYNRIAPISGDHLEALDSPLLSRLSVRYVMSEVQIDLSQHPQYRQVDAEGGVFIYENTAALPRAYIAEAAAAGAVNPATIREAGIDQVSVDVMNSAGNPADMRTLVLTDSFANGWRAYIKPLGAPDALEQETPITLANGNFRGVQLPPGTWTVRFRYSPQSVQIGAFGTFIAGVLIIFMLLIWLWQRFYNESAVDLAASQGTGNVRRVAKNSIAPIVLSLFNRAIDLGFALVMLRVLSPVDVGIFYYIVVIIGWFDILTNFGLNTFLTRDVARNPGAAAYYLRRTSVIRLGMFLIWLPAVVVFVIANQHNVLSTALSSAGLLTLILLYVSLIPGSLNSGLSALFYAFEKAEIPAAISTGTAILSVILRLGALIAGFGIVGLAGASVVLNIITLIVLFSQALPLLRSARAAAGSQNNPSELSTVSYRMMISDAWPLMINHLLATMFFKIDVILLQPLQGDVTVARYSVAYKWVDAIGVIPSFFTMALLPVMSRQAQNDKPGLLRNYQLAVKLLIIVALPIAVVTTFLAPLLITILAGSRYLPDGARALQLMIWFIPIGWINSLTQYVLIALNMQRPLKWPFVAGVIFNVVANLVFIPLYSYQAASVITILSEVVLQIGFYVLLRRVLGTVAWGAILLRPLIAAALMFGALAVFWSMGSLFGSVLGLLAAGVTYPAALIVLRPLDSDEIARLSPLLPGPLRRFARA